MLNRNSLKRNYKEIEEEKTDYNMNSINDVKLKLDKKDKRLTEISREMMGLNMQIKCLKSQLNKLCKHKWVKIKEDTGVYNRPPLKCVNCNLIKSVTQG
jgi:hypothetical protein